MSNLVEDAFYHDVPVPCPNCESLDVAVFFYTKEDGEDVHEGMCQNCQSRWYMG